MTAGDAEAMINALSAPETLLVFATIATTTSTARPPTQPGHPTTQTVYITPFGLHKQTSLPLDVVEQAAQRLKQVGLLETITDPERGYQSWRVNETALASPTSSQPRPTTPG